MERKIIYTQKVIRDIEQTVNWLEENASLQSAQNLLVDIENLEDRLSKYPESGRPTSNENIRYLIVQEHKILFYRYNSKSVRVLSLFDTRQDPKKRPF